MPLSIEFIARLETDVYPGKRVQFLISANEQMKIVSMVPMDGPELVILAALERDYLGPGDDSFWSKQSLDGEGPVSTKYADHILRFYRDQVTLRLDMPKAIQANGTFSVFVNKYSFHGTPILFKGVVSQLICVQPA